jgi:hypothetical protein
VGLLALASCVSGCLRDVNACAVDGDCAATLVCAQGECVPGAVGPGADAGGADVGGADAGAPDVAQGDADAADAPCCVLARGAFAGPADITISSDGVVHAAVVDVQGDAVAVFSFDAPGEEVNRADFALGPAGLSSVSLASDGEGGAILAFEDIGSRRLVAAETADGETWGDPEDALMPPTGPTASHQHASLSPWMSSYGVVALEVTEEDNELDTNYGVVPVFGRTGIPGANPTRLGGRADVEFAVLNTALTRTGDGLLALWSYDGGSVQGVLLDGAGDLGAPFDVREESAGESFSGGLRAAPGSGASVWITYAIYDEVGTYVEVASFDRESGRVTALPRPALPDGTVASEPALVAGGGGTVHLVYHALSADDPDVSALTMATWNGAMWSYEVLDPDTGGSLVALGVWDDADDGVHVVYTHGAGVPEGGALEYLWVAP